jgi:hypothetical protein
VDEAVVPVVLLNSWDGGGKVVTVLQDSAIERFGVLEYLLGSVMDDVVPFSIMDASGVHDMRGEVLVTFGMANGDWVVGIINNEVQKQPTVAEVVDESEQRIVLVNAKTKVTGGNIQKAQFLEPFAGPELIVGENGGILVTVPAGGVVVLEISTNA